MSLRRAISRTSRPEKIRLTPQLTSESRMLTTPTKTTAPRPVTGTAAARRIKAATGGDSATM